MMVAIILIAKQKAFVVSHSLMDHVVFPLVVADHLDLDFVLHAQVLHLVHRVDLVQDYAFLMSQWLI